MGGGGKWATGFHISSQEVRQLDLPPMEILLCSLLEQTQSTRGIPAGPHGYIGGKSC